MRSFLAIRSLRAPTTMACLKRNFDSFVRDPVRSDPGLCAWASAASSGGCLLAGCLFCVLPGRAIPLLPPVGGPWLLLPWLGASAGVLWFSCLPWVPLPHAVSKSSVIFNWCLSHVFHPFYFPTFSNHDWAIPALSVFCSFFLGGGTRTNRNK